MDSEHQWEPRAKIKHCESRGLKSERDEAEEKQELLVPPWRIKGAVKYWKALSVPKGSLRWVCYFNSLRVVLKDNLFLIPPASWSKWFSFLSLPFHPMRARKALWEGMAGDRSLAPQPDPLSIIPRCFLHAERCPHLLIPHLNWSQAMPGECISTELWFVVGAALPFPLITEFLPLWGCPIAQHLWPKSPLLSVWNVH